MARTMKRFGPLAFFDNSLNDVLTAPSGHKYELIESWIITLGAGGEIAAVYLKTAGPAYTFVDVIVGMAAAQYVWRNQHQGVVANAGEGFSVACYGVGGLWSAMLTYIDVDL